VGAWRKASAPTLQFASRVTFASRRLSAFFFIIILIRKMAELLNFFLFFFPPGAGDRPKIHMNITSVQTADFTLSKIDPRSVAVVAAVMANWG